MIYKLLIKNSAGKHKELYLTEDTPNRVVRRACSTYAISPQDITVIAEYKETGESYELVKEFVDQGSAKDKKKAELATLMFKQATPRNEPYKTQYMEKHKMEEVKVNSEEDVLELLKKYKKVKVYWETTEQRGVHSYYALVR